MCRLFSQHNIYQKKIEPITVAFITHSKFNVIENHLLRTNVKNFTPANDGNVISFVANCTISNFDLMLALDGNPS